MARMTLPGQAALAWLTTIPTAPTAPTQAEITAGVDLIGTSQDEELMDFDGWTVNSSTIPTPGYASHQVGNITGDQTYPDSRLSFYKDDTDEVIYDALAEGNVGWVAIMLDGQLSTNEVTLFPATVSSRVRRVARNEAHIFDVNFSIDVPYEGTQAA